MKIVSIILLVFMVFQVHAAQVEDDKMIVGLLILKPELSRDQAIKIADQFAARSEAKTVYVRKASQNSYGIGLSWSYSGGQTAFDAETHKLRKLGNEFAKAKVVAGNDFASSVIWLK